jgi:hypothetical protein
MFLTPQSGTKVGQNGFLSTIGQFFSEQPKRENPVEVHLTL